MFARLRARRTARQGYFTLDAQMGHLFAELAIEAQPERRARLLDDVADLADAASSAYRRGFRRDLRGIDRAARIVLEADLLRLLAGVEMAVAQQRPREWLHSPLTTEVAAAPVLDAMAAEPDLDKRMDMLPDLYAVIQPHVGGRTAEVVACIPWPEATAL